MEPMLIVVALGGNALLRRGEPLTAEVQLSNVRSVSATLAGLAREHRLVITHGNGPQVGLLALQSEALGEIPSYPLDVLGAESAGMIGYMIEQGLGGLLEGRPIATLLTMVEVDPGDPAFATPSKPIGPAFGADRARELIATRGWAMRAEGDGYRRIVPSPEPERIVELDTIRALVDHGVTVICTGGGGIPVAREDGAGLHGVEAVIDKDLSSTLLATELGADRLLLLTDVDAVVADWPEPARRAIRRASSEALRALDLDPGSIGPKVEAACRFVEATGRPAAIGALGNAAQILRGSSGTTVAAGTELLEYAR